jgi:DNA-binding MarR family transcriptional regulator
VSAARGPDTTNLGFLLAKASQRWNERLGEGFAAAGYAEVRPSYGSVLLPLWEQDGLRMGRLAERARLSKQTMTTLVRLCERDGLVERAPDPEDGRATVVSLTGRAKGFRSVAADVIAALEDEVSTRARRDLARALKEVMEL